MIQEHPVTILAVIIAAARRIDEVLEAATGQRTNAVTLSLRPAVYAQLRQLIEDKQAPCLARIARDQLNHEYLLLFGETPVFIYGQEPPAAPPLPRPTLRLV